MEAREKLDFLLEQVRLCLAKKDYLRAEIIAKKVTSKHINKEEMQDLKLKYYKLMLELHTYNDAYLKTCLAYEQIFRTKVVQEDEKQWTEALSLAVMYVCLSPFDSEVSDRLEAFKVEPKLKTLPAYKEALVKFTTPELISWPMAIEGEFKKSEAFQGPKGELLMKDFHKRVVQHNLRVVSKYYSQISSARLSQLLQLDGDKLEEFLSEMVSSQQLFAKIDRCEGVITFTRKLSPELKLNAWAEDISKLLTLVEKTCHLVNKENMINGVN